VEPTKGAVAAPVQAGPAASGVNVCSRCGHDNAPHMRFCVQCGNGLSPPAPLAALAAVASSPAAESAPAAASSGRACWRCRGVGDPGSAFCKFCGARYDDAPADAHGGNGAPPLVASSPLAPEATAPAKRPDPAEALGGAGVVAEPRGFATVIEAGTAAAKSDARLVAILKDGSDGRVYPLSGNQVDIGSREGDVVLGEDPYLSFRHARLLARDDGWSLVDLDSVNGIFMRIREPEPLSDGDMILIGQQVMRFELLSDGELPLGPASSSGVLVFGTPEVPRVARLLQYTTEGVGRDVHYLYRDETVLGRENGDIVFTDDPFLSRRHAAILIDRVQKRYVLKDLGSSNGSSLRFRGERKLSPGDQFRIGRHLFRFDQGAGRGA
jgi:pSer/pThr/pTyr-binding forkhead associated (FHA) protein